MGAKNTNIQGGSISQNPAEMTVGEYISENLNRMDPESPEYTALKNFYNTQVKGTPLANKYTGNVGSTFKDMFEKASGVKFGELHGQPEQTQMQEPEVVTEARQPFTGSNPDKVTNKVLSKQVENIHKFDEATAAGKGKNTPAAKQAQEAQQNSRELINNVKKDGVQNIPVTDPTSDSWYTKDSEGGTTEEDGQPDDSDEDSGEEKDEEKSEKPNGLNKLLLADILMTGVRNALHYRPAFRTAYGEDIEGRDFGTEKSLAMKLAEENMKRGLERSNQRKDTESQTESEIAATKRKGSDKELGKSMQNLALANGTQTETKNETHTTPLGSTQEQTSKTKPIDLNQNWNNVRTSN